MPYNLLSSIQSILYNTGCTLAKLLNFTDENPVRHLIFQAGWFGLGGQW